jgi:protein gp37
MGDRSIEWTEKVWNPVTGCTKVSQGARTVTPSGCFRGCMVRCASSTDVAGHPDRLDIPLHWTRVFMSIPAMAVLQSHGVKCVVTGFTLVAFVDSAKRIKLDRL